MRNRKKDKDMDKQTSPSKGAQPRKFDSVMAQYLASLRNYPLLPHPKVVELFQTLEDGVSSVATKHAARQKLTVSNLRLVVSIAKQYMGHKLPMEDLIQEGNIGLMKAITRFDWKRGYRFSTYATWWIKQAIGQHVLKNKRTIRLPAHAATVQRKLMQAAAAYREEFGQEATLEELTEIVGASETVVKATMHAGRGTISLQQPAYISRGGGEGAMIQDVVPDTRSGCSPFQNVSEKQLLEITKRVMSKLTPKEEAILRLRFGLVEDGKNSDAYPITEGEMAQVMAGKGLR
jgi:RNA polymerase primary sigma factor